MEENAEKITIQVNERGELIYVDLGKGPTNEPTHNLYRNPPPGQYVGSMDLGKIYFYKQPDGSMRRCHHFRCVVI
jgi:hypothetical protein